MTYRDKLLRRIETTGSGLCVGLDPRPEKHGDHLADFLRQVIEETAEFAACYKPNMAYFEALGSAGIRLLEDDVLARIPDDIPVILDAKRGDIGSTQEYYAKGYFETWDVDAVTLNPYMGFETIEPFLGYEDQGKGLYLLGVTSNAGSGEIQRQALADGREVFEIVNAMCGRSPMIGLVLGLTSAAGEVLEKISDVPLLIPGLGAQGGDLEALKGQQRTAPNVVNVSRGILYNEAEKSFAEKAQSYANRIAELR